jgi:hypothetical protein
MLILTLTDEIRSRDSSVDIATGYGLDGRCPIPDMAKRFFLHTVQTGSGA